MLFIAFLIMRNLRFIVFSNYLHTARYTFLGSYSHSQKLILAKIIYVTLRYSKNTTMHACSTVSSFEANY